MLGELGREPDPCGMNLISRRPPIYVTKSRLHCQCFDRWRGADPGQLAGLWSFSEGGTQGKLQLGDALGSHAVSELTPLLLP